MRLLRSSKCSAMPSPRRLGPRWLGRRGGMAVNPMRVEPFLRALVRQMEQDRSDAKVRLPKAERTQRKSSLHPPSQQ